MDGPITMTLHGEGAEEVLELPDVEATFTDYLRGHGYEGVGRVLFALFARTHGPDYFDLAQTLAETWDEE